MAHIPYVWNKKTKEEKTNSEKEIRLITRMVVEGKLKGTIFQL